MPHSFSDHSSGIPADPFWGALILGLVAAFLGALAASAAAAAVVTNAPSTAAALAKPLLCPTSSSARLLTTLGDPYINPNGDTVQDSSYSLKCYDAQGMQQPDDGKHFTEVWWGVWMGTVALLAGGLCFALVYIRRRARSNLAARSGPFAGQAGSVMGRELDELRRIEQAEQQSRGKRR